MTWRSRDARDLLGISLCPKPKSNGDGMQYIVEISIQYKDNISDLSSGVWSRVELCNRVDVPIQPVVV